MPYLLGYGRLPASMRLNVSTLAMPFCFLDMSTFYAALPPFSALILSTTYVSVAGACF